MRKNTTDYDVIIVGGGMVGLAQALQLADLDLRVAIIEPNPVLMDWGEATTDSRVSAITRASEKLFNSLDAWPTAISAYTAMHVWDGESSQGSIDFDAKSIRQPNLGHIVENRVLRKALFEAMQARMRANKIDWLCPERCQQVSYEDDKATLTLESGRTLSAKLLIAADGAFSWLRTQSNVGLTQKPYEHQAIVCTLETEQEHNKIAYQRFDHSGPLAFLPLENKHQCSIVWSLKASEAQTMMELDDDTFEQHIANRFERHLGNCKLIGKRQSFPLFQRSSERMINHRLAIVGDAAHTIHPLAGQGVNLGFSDTQCLTHTIVKALKQQKDIGLETSLRAFERERSSENLIMQQAMMGFKKLFEQELPIVQMLRGTGMAIANEHSIAKGELMKKALGLD